MQDDVPRTEALLSQGANVNSRQENRILLVAALVDNHLGTARVLLRFHPDVNAVNPNSGLTALECACAWGAKDIVETLVARDADINAHAVEGTSALSVAAHGGRADLVSYLLAHGAYIHLVDSHGKTPLMVTQRRYDDTLDPKKKARIFSVLTLLQKAENEKPLGP
ncbi:MAG: hypothetical protein JWL77_1949 [Chthonomonadaceae bacterium]|nr:hypothetical protein [Chthonomonadaceae bacterium]